MRIPRRWHTAVPAMLAAALIAAQAMGAAPVPAASPAENAAETESVPAAGGAAPADTLSFVQQGLTIHELEKELERLRGEQAKVSEDIAALQEDLKRQGERVKERKEAAGRVLRAYYMGHRDHMWLLLLKVRSLNEALAVLDYLQAIWMHDTRTLALFRKAYDEMAAMLAELTAREERLGVLIGEYEAQYDRKLREQAELERRLAELDEEEREAQLEAIAAATSEWEEIGVPLFENVLAALSGAMAELPELLSDPSLIAVVDGGLEVRLTDETLNAFLQQRDPIFSMFTFHFSPDGLTVSGAVNDRTASLSGTYEVQNEPVNALHFVIGSIVFNGAELPDTTKKAMQEQYDLTFEPGNLVAGLTVRELFHEEGMLRVKIELSLF